MGGQLDDDDETKLKDAGFGSKILHREIGRVGAATEGGPTNTIQQDAKEEMGE